ncbi:MAG: hypothetical protein ACI31K_01830, partial [Limosilactobacillus reuteri]
SLFQFKFQNLHKIFYALVIEHWWADFKAIWIAHLPKAQTLTELEQQVETGITYFTEEFISAKRNDLTAAEYRFGKAS